MKEDLICGLTPSEIETLKEQHKALVLIEVKNEGETYHAIFKEPTFDQMRSMNKIAKNDEIESIKIAYNNSILLADDEIQNRPFLKIKAVKSLMLRVQKTTSEAKNL